MAIQRSYDRSDTPAGIPLSNAYIKIHDVNIKVSTDEAWINILVYGDKAARDSQCAISFDKKTIKIKISELRPISFDKAGLMTAAYNYIKKLPQYTGTDV